MKSSFVIIQEVDRIRKEHPDDASAVSNERVKGSLKVTRAFGAGFLKQVHVTFNISWFLNIDRSLLTSL